MFRRRLVMPGVSAIALASVMACSPNPGKGLAEQADRHFEKKEYVEAGRAYVVAIKADPKSGELRLKLGKVYEALNDWTNASAEYVRAADLLPDNRDAQLAAAQALLATGQFEDARTRAEQIVQKNPGDVAAQIVRGKASAGMKDFEDALTDLTAAVKRDPNQSSAYSSLGGIAFARGRLEEAEAAFKQAVATAPKEVGPRLALANFYWGRQRKADAEATLKGALEIDVNGVAANRALVVFYGLTNRPADAERHLKVLAADPKNLEAALALADFFIEHQRTAEARPVLDRLAATKEGYAAAEARRATIEYEAGAKESAHTRIDNLLKREPSNAQVIVHKGGWLLLEGKTSEALDRAKAAVSADPTFGEAHFLLGRALMAQRNYKEAVKSFTETLKRSPRAVGAKIQLAGAYLGSGDPKAAIAAANEAVTADPLSSAAHLVRARAFIADHQLEKAREDLALLVRGGAGESIDVQVAVGALALRQGDMALARATFQEALKRDPQQLEALAGLAQIDVADKKYSEAQARVAAAAKGSPANAGLLLIAGQIAAREGKFEEAERQLRAAIAVAPDVMGAYGTLAQIYVRQNKLEEARREYEVIASKQPDAVGPQTMVALILQLQNRHAEAKVKYQRILGINARAAVAANNLAYIYLTDDTNLQEALQLAQKAKAAMPDDPDVNDTLGWAYLKNDLVQPAIDALQAAVKANPRHPEYQYHLGMAHVKAGNKEKARLALTIALQSREQFVGIEDARRTLATLGN